MLQQRIANTRVRVKGTKLYLQQHQKREAALDGGSTGRRVMNWNPSSGSINNIVLGNLRSTRNRCRDLGRKVPWIGKLMADGDEARRQRSDLAVSMREINQKLSIIPQLAKDVEDLKKPVRDLTKLKNKGAGILIGVGVSSSAAGMAMFKGIQSFLSGN